MGLQAESRDGWSSFIGYAKPYKLWLFISVAAFIANSALNILIGVFMKHTIDFTLKEQAGVTFELAATAVIIIIAGVTIKYLSVVSSGYFSANISRDLRTKITGKIQSLPVKSVENNHSGEFISRMNHDLPVVETFLNSTYPSLIYNPLIFIGTVAYLSFIDWRLLLITTCLIPITIYMANKIGLPAKTYSQARSESAAKEIAVAKDMINGIFLSKAFNLEETVFKKYTKAVSVLVGNISKYEKVLAILTPFQMIIRLVPFLFCCIFGGYFAIHGWISTGSLFVFIFLLNYLVEPMSEIPAVMNQYRSALVSLGRIEELLKMPGERTSGEQFSSLSSNPAIQFQEVCFSYENENKILDNLSFEVPKGKNVAIVGRSGSGKSTIFKLLSGFCTHQEGSISIYGQSLEKWSLQSLRERISLVSQETYLFPVTIMENISYAKPEADIDEIVAAAKAANAHEFIVKLPEGYHTLVGERGVKLSGGQKQRLSIAAAILKGSEIVLLDEPTSSLDAHSESLIQEAIRNRMKDRTIIVIAHRISTIKDADLILVLDGGRIAEAGTHHQLVEWGGLYKKLYQWQLENEVDTLTF